MDSYCPSNKPKNAVLSFATLLPILDSKSTCLEALWWRSERCLPLHQPLTSTRLSLEILCSCNPAVTNPAWEAHIYIWGQLTNARGWCPTGPALWELALHRNAWYSVELVGIFLAFLVPHGVSSQFFAKKPGRVGSPNHCQAYFITYDFHFKPFPDPRPLFHHYPLLLLWHSLFAHISLQTQARVAVSSMNYLAAKSSISPCSPGQRNQRMYFPHTNFHIY